jgi:hypothetical protein
MSVFKAGEESGASGSFFFFSHDRSFIIKTVTAEEKDYYIDKVALGYFKYLRENPKSLIARLYGIFSVKIDGIEPVNLLLMAHTISTSDCSQIERIFDLKGSSVNRETSYDDRTLKDTNLKKMLMTKEVVL